MESELLGHGLWEAGTRNGSGGGAESELVNGMVDVGGRDRHDLERKGRHHLRGYFRYRSVQRMVSILEVDSPRS